LARINVAYDVVTEGDKEYGQVISDNTEEVESANRAFEEYNELLD
jgi:hypothetical protein